MSLSIRDALRGIDLFAPLPDAFVDSLAGFTALRRVRAGETVFCQGEPSPYCFGILSGEVAIRRVSKDPRFPSKLLGVLGPGDLFGESALLEETSRGAMASVNKDGELIAIVGSKFREWLLKEPAAGVPLLMGLLDRSLDRLRQTSHELSIVYGVGRLLALPQGFSERLAASLEFLKSAMEGVDDIYCLERSAYWNELEYRYPEAGESRLPAIPLDSPLAVLAKGASGAVSLETPEERRSLADLGIPCANAASLALVPFLDMDHPDPLLQGFLLMASRETPKVFTRDMLLMLSTMANPLAEAFSRQRRQEDASAQVRLSQSRGSVNL